MADSEKSWVDRDRAEYEADTFKWLSERFRRITTRSDFDWQTDHLKWFVHSASEALLRELNRMRDSLILWLGAIAIVALASAGLWIGSAAVAVILILRWRLSLRRDRMLWRFDRFRKTFGKLCEEDITEREDKQYLHQMRHSIEFPLAATGEVSADDLWKIETLYIEYCSHLSHVHGGFDIDPADPEKWKSSVREATLKCELCAAVYRVREHIEGVLSRFEKEIEAGRAGLISKVDGSDLKPAIFAKPFLEKYWKWQDYESKQDQAVLKSLRGKEHWTFEEADMVRELCREPGGYATDYGSWLDSGGKEMFELLTGLMESAAKLCDAEKVWQSYEEARDWQKGHARSLKDIRRALARHQPQTTIREMGYPHLLGSFVGGRELRALTNFGFDEAHVERHLSAASKFVERENRERGLEQKMFLAARRFFALEQTRYARGAWKK